MSKLRLFLENILVYGVGGIISKLIPLFLVPVVTRLLPDTSFYGINDLTTTAASFGSAVAQMGMYDAMYRMFFEKDEEDFKKDVCSTALTYVFIVSVILFFIIIISRRYIALYFFGDIKYEFLVYLTAVITFLHATNNIIAAPTRMQNKRSIYIVANTVGPLISYVFAIALILKGYYLTALPIGAALSSLIIEVSFYRINKEWFRIGFIDGDLLKQLLKIGIPLLPNFLVYWVFGSFNKIMIANLLSVGAVGIYSVGSKLGQVSQLIYTAFSGGWQYFAFSTMREENQVETNSLIFEYLGAISFVAGMFMCVFARPIFEILFTGEYVLGYVVAPYLFLAPLLQMLFQIAGNQFLIVKRTWPIVLVLAVGAAASVLFNLFLIPVLGIEGAAIATLLGYVISVIITLLVLHKIELFKVTKRLLLIVVLVFSYFLCWRLIFKDYFLMSFLIAVLFSLAIVFLYRIEIKYVVDLIKSSLKRKKEIL